MLSVERFGCRARVLSGPLSLLKISSEAKSTDNIDIGTRTHWHPPISWVFPQKSILADDGLLWTYKFGPLVGHDQRTVAAERRSEFECPGIRLSSVLARPSEPSKTSDTLGGKQQRCAPELSDSHTLPLNVSGLTPQRGRSLPSRAGGRSQRAGVSDIRAIGPKRLSRSKGHRFLSAEAQSRRDRLRSASHSCAVAT